MKNEFNLINAKNYLSSQYHDIALCVSFQRRLESIAQSYIPIMDPNLRWDDKL
jgi:hypothetical protein